MDTQKPKESKSEYCRWSERFDQRSIHSPCKSIDHLDHIYVYLVDGTTPICYWKGKVSQFTDPNPEYRWLNLTNDTAIGKVAEAY
jgi:hypothetical protein